MTNLTRRKLLLGAAFSLVGGFAISRFFHPALSPAHAVAAQSTVGSDPFVHRAYLGWIRDFSSTPRPNDEWPSLLIDDGLMADYTALAAFMQQNNLNELSVWGFFTSRNWSTDVENTIDTNRGDQIRSLINIAHNQGIKVFSGLGLYSWGFDDIIQADPSLCDGQNFHAMCLENPQSWDWQQRVIDFVFSFPIDGAEMQCADQGRCHCPSCAAIGDIDYYSQIVDKCASYIKQKWPNSTLGVSNWGMSFQDPNDLPHMKTMTSHIDFITDNDDSARRQDPTYRKTLISSISPCAYGSGARPAVEPPQHWSHDHWFLPTIRRTSENLLSLYADGGRSAENFARTPNNPSDEVSILTVAQLEANPTANWQDLLRGILSNLYGPQDDNTLTSLVNLFLTAEDAYFNNANFNPLSELDIEPLVGSSPGPLIYITSNMDDTGRANYKTALQQLYSQAQGLVGAVSNQSKISLVVTCIGNVLADLG